MKEYSISVYIEDKEVKVSCAEVNTQTAETVYLNKKSIRGSKRWEETYKHVGALLTFLMQKEKLEGGL